MKRLSCKATLKSFDVFRLKDKWAMSCLNRIAMDEKYFFCLEPEEGQNENSINNVIVAKGLEQEDEGIPSPAVRAGPHHARGELLRACIRSTHPHSVMAFPFVVKPPCGNVFGFVHGGFLWTLNDVFTSIHLIHAIWVRDQVLQGHVTVNLDMKYTSALEIGTPVIALTRVEKMTKRIAHTSVDFISFPTLFEGRGGGEKGYNEKDNEAKLLKLVELITDEKLQDAHPGELHASGTHSKAILETKLSL